MEGMEGMEYGRMQDTWTYGPTVTNKTKSAKSNATAVYSMYDVPITPRVARARA